MKNSIRRVALGLVLFLGAAASALAAPGTPVVVGTAGQASLSGADVSVTTSAAINPGDMILVLATSAANQTPNGVACLLKAGPACSISANGAFREFSGPGVMPASTGSAVWNMVEGSREGIGQSNPARAASFYTYATDSIPSGSTVKVYFGGPVGAKAVTILAIPSVEVSAAPIKGITTNGATPSGAIAFSTPMPIPASNLVLATSFIAGGGSDSYTEDAGFTFLHQTGAGAWPTIRVAYKLTSGPGVVSYSLTDTTPRAWITSYQIAR